MLVSLDGTLIGLVPNDYLAQLAGDGNGGASPSTGWQLVTVAIPNVAAGSHTLRLGGFNNKKTFNDESTELLIDDVVVTGSASAPPADEAPVITSTPVLTATADLVYTYQVAATDANGGPLSFSLDAAPAGMTISATGLISWTPTAGQVSPPAQAVMVRVTDNTALFATQVYSIMVSGAGTAVTVIEAHFDVNEDGFIYADSLFPPVGAADTDAYESGVRVATGGFSGGALRVALGGLDNNTRNNMSGGWSRSFTLPAPATLTLTLRYKLTQSPHYESDENSQMLISVDGQFYGTPPNDYVSRVDGNGNGGPPLTTGWQLATVTIPNVAAGTHTLGIGGFNNQKTSRDESTEVLMDDVLLVGN
jgi:hypothetical protein